MIMLKNFLVIMLKVMKKLVKVQSKYVSITKQENKNHLDNKKLSV